MHSKRFGRWTAWAGAALAAAAAVSACSSSPASSTGAGAAPAGASASSSPSALATGVSIAAYTVVDGIGVRASGNWIAYTGGIFAFFLLVPLWYLARRKHAAFAISAAEAGRAVAGGLISLAAYGAIIWAMQGNAMGAVSAQELC